MERLSFYDVQELFEINIRIREIMNKESTTLYRMAWNAERHGCSKTLVEEIRTEARMLHNGGIGEWNLLDPFRYWKYAFQTSKRLDWGY